MPAPNRRGNTYTDREEEEYYRPPVQRSAPRTAPTPTRPAVRMPADPYERSPDPYEDPNEYYAWRARRYGEMPDYEKAPVAYYDWAKRFDKMRYYTAGAYDFWNKPVNAPESPHGGTFAEWYKDTFVPYRAGDKYYPGTFGQWLKKTFSAEPPERYPGSSMYYPGGSPASREYNPRGKEENASWYYGDKPTQKSGPLTDYSSPGPFPNASSSYVGPDNWGRTPDGGKVYLGPGEELFQRTVLNGRTYATPRVPLSFAIDYPWETTTNWYEPPADWVNDGNWKEKRGGEGAMVDETPVLDYWGDGGGGGGGGWGWGGGGGGYDTHPSYGNTGWRQDPAMYFSQLVKWVI